MRPGPDYLYEPGYLAPHSFVIKYLLLYFYFLSRCRAFSASFFITRFRAENLCFVGGHLTFGALHHFLKGLSMAGFVGGGLGRLLNLKGYCSQRRRDSHLAIVRRAILVQSRAQSNPFTLPPRRLNSGIRRGEDKPQLHSRPGKESWCTSPRRRKPGSTGSGPGTGITGRRGNAQ